jgi:hypothetical protein
VTRWLLALLVALHVLAAGHVAWTTDWTTPSFVSGDHLSYRQLVETPGAAYRDKTVAFPPLSYAAFVVIEDHGTPTGGGRLLVLTQLACDLAVAAALAWGWGRRAASAWLVLLLPMLWEGWIFARIDLLSVALCVGGLALVRRRMPRPGGLALAAACLAKLWPVALLPGLGVERQRKAAAWTVGGLVAGAGAWLATGGVDGVRDVVTFGGSKGWQAESTVGAVLYLRDGGPLVAEGGAWRIGTEPSWSGLALGLAVVAVVAAAWWLATRARPGHVTPAADLARVAAVGAVIVLAPILSPQYLVWLLPFVAIVATDRVLTGLTFASSALTALVAWHYEDFVDGYGSWRLAVMARNGLLVAVVVLALVRLRSCAEGVSARDEARRARRTPRSGWPPDSPSSPDWSDRPAAGTSGTTSPARRS